MSELRGCTDGNCIIRKPEGMHTNGGCGCERELRHALGLQDSRRFIHALRERQREVAELRKTLRSLLATFDAIHDRHYDNQDCDEDASGHRSPNRDMNTVVDCSVALDEIERVEPKSQSAQERSEPKA